MSSSEPQLPEEPGRKSPTTQEIPIAQPPTGATAVQQLPPHPGATTPPPVHPVEAAVPTGPVDFVPGLPGAGTPPPPPPARPLPVSDGHLSDGHLSDGPVAPAPTPGAPAAEAEDDPGRSWPDTLLDATPADESRPRRRRVRTPNLRGPRNRAVLLGTGLAVLSVVLLELGLTMRGDDGESYWAGIPLWSAFATVCALLGLGAYAVFIAAGTRVKAEGLWRIAAAGLIGLAAFWLLVVLPVVATDRGFVLTAALATLGAALWVGPRAD